MLRRFVTLQRLESTNDGKRGKRQKGSAERAPAYGEQTKAAGVVGRKNSIKRGKQRDGVQPSLPLSALSLCGCTV